MSKRKQDKNPKPRIPSASIEALDEFKAWLLDQRAGFLDAATATREMMKAIDLPMLSAQLEYSNNGVSVINNLLAQLGYERLRHERWGACESAAAGRPTGGGK